MVQSAANGVRSRKMTASRGNTVQRKRRRYRFDLDEVRLEQSAGFVEHHRQSASSRSIEVPYRQGLKASRR